MAFLGALEFPFHGGAVVHLEGGDDVVKVQPVGSCEDLFDLPLLVDAHFREGYGHLGKGISLSVNHALHAKRPDALFAQGLFEFIGAQGRGQESQENQSRCKGPGAWRGGGVHHLVRGKFEGV